MSIAENMLSRILGQSENAVCTIDFDTRMIDIPSNIKCLGVESDDDMTRVQFVMPQYYHGVDLSKFDININYINARAEGDVYHVTDAVTEAETITFSWLVGRYALSYKGVVKFNVCLKMTDTNEPALVVKELNTTIASLPVLEGLETSEAVVQKYADILLQWEYDLETKFNTLSSRIDKAIEEKTTDERIEGILNAYLTENPVDTITEEELKEAVEAYFVENPIEVDTLTDEELRAAIEAYFVENPVEDGLTSVSWNDISDKPSSFNPSEHSHTVTWEDVNGKPETFPPSEHSHEVTWENVSGKPETFPPSEHAHDYSDKEVTFKKVTADVIVGAVYM